MKYIRFILFAFIIFFSGYYIGNEQYLKIKTCEKPTVSFAEQEKVKRSIENKIVAAKQKRVKRVLGEDTKLLQTMTKDIHDNKNNTKEKLGGLPQQNRISEEELREDGVPEEDIEMMASAFKESDSSSPGKKQLTAEQLIFKDIIAADLRNDGLPEEEIKRMAEEMARTENLETYNQPASTPEEMRDNFIADLREDGIPEEEIEMMTAALFTPEEPDTRDSAVHSEILEQEDDDLQEEIMEEESVDEEIFE
ncbi:MAG: hypothetical protein ACL93V_10450 [Candidatus Electrothrix sp. YB6]